jgi:hypothetical protein
MYIAPSRHHQVLDDQRDLVRTTAVFAKNRKQR